jgi:hypothetical protein
MSARALPTSPSTPAQQDTQRRLSLLLNLPGNIILQMTGHSTQRVEAAEKVGEGLMILSRHMLPTILSSEQLDQLRRAAANKRDEINAVFGAFFEGLTDESEQACLAENLTTMLPMSR